MSESAEIDHEIDYFEVIIWPVISPDQQDHLEVHRD